MSEANNNNPAEVKIIKKIPGEYYLNTNKPKLEYIVGNRINYKIRYILRKFIDDKISEHIGNTVGNMIQEEVPHAFKLSNLGHWDLLNNDTTVKRIKNMAHFLNSDFRLRVKKQEAEEQPKKRRGRKKKVKKK